MGFLRLVTAAKTLRVMSLLRLRKCRVNGPGRFEWFEELGADSMDGSGLARYSHMREAIWKAYNEPTLFTSPLN
jgi:hypothetical protein